MKRSLEIIEKICMAGIVFLLLIITAGVAYLCIETEKKEEPPVSQTEPAEEKKELSDALEFLPSNLYLGEKLPQACFQDAEGNTVDLQETYEGRIQIMIFWGSWCKYCDKVLENINECLKVLEEYPEIELILVNKTDPEKEETVERAEAYLDERKIDLESYYDEDLMMYRSYGIKRIPTILVLDKDGYLRDVLVQAVETVEQWRDIFDNARFGADQKIISQLESKWMGEDGQIFTELTDQSLTTPSGQDVLSESQGLIMEYAALTEKEELFKRTEQFAQNNLKRNDIYSWYVTADGEQADANAILDDLRIYQALAMAEDLWGGQSEKMKALAKGIFEHNTDGKYLYSFYDFTQKKAGNVISLCYLDFHTLRMLGDQKEEFLTITENMHKIMEEGYISDTFPLYYASYDYETKKYSKESLHTAEALLTLYHLAKVGEMRDTSREWLRENLSKPGLYARYGIDGKTVSGYEYESTAVYAIAALIGIEENDPDIYTKAVLRMRLLGEQNAETKNIRVFDLLMPLLTAAKGERIHFN